jgi:hypothetical protein
LADAIIEGRGELLKADEDQEETNEKEAEEKEAVGQ